MAAFDVFTDGLRLVDRFARLFNTQYITRDPLSGVVDGTNTVFYATYSPIVTSGSTGVYLNNTLQAASAYTADLEAGAFIFSNPPSVQPTATYTISSYPDRVIRGTLVAGFDEMESRWYRGFSLSSVQGTGQIVLATEDSTSGYIVDTSGSDPTIGTTFWSLSSVQRAYYARCTQLAWYLMLAGEHALTDFVWQEAQGLRVDKSSTVKNLLAVKQELEKSMVKVQEQAMIEFYGSSDVYGGAILTPLTREYVAHRFWERASRQENWRDSTTYIGQGY